LASNGELLSFFHINANGKVTFKSLKIPNFAQARVLKPLTASTPAIKLGSKGFEPTSVYGNVFHHLDTDSEAEFLEFVSKCLPVDQINRRRTELHSPPVAFTTASPL
jgi:hypothetical protein